LRSSDSLHIGNYPCWDNNLKIMPMIYKSVSYGVGMANNFAYWLGKPFSIIIYPNIFTYAITYKNATLF